MTRRYVATIRLSYQVALHRLFRYARTSTDQFEYGPMSLDAMEDSGLVVSAPSERDMKGVAAVLAGVPGLYPSD